jgi:hypothetical protein
LYSKAAILESLLEVSRGSEGNVESGAEGSLTSRVKSLRDVVEVRFQEEEKDETDKLQSPTSSKWVCPITKKPLGPGVKAVYLVPCGHAFSETAIKEMAGENCLQVSAQQMASEEKF